MAKEYTIVLAGGTLLGQRDLIPLFSSLGTTLFSNLETEGYRFPRITIQSGLTKKEGEEEEIFHFLFYDGHSLGHSRLLKKYVSFLDSLWVFFSLSGRSETQECILFGEPRAGNELGVLPVLAPCPKREPLPVVFQAVQEAYPSITGYKSQFFEMFFRACPFSISHFERDVFYDYHLAAKKEWRENHYLGWYGCQRESFLWTLRQLRGESNSAE